MTASAPGRQQKSTAFDDSSTSGLALAIFAPVGVIGAVATMPLQASGLACWAIAIAAQVLFSALVISSGALIPAGRQPRGARMLRAGFVGVAGALRGAALVVGAGWVGAESVSGSGVLARAANSALICMVVLGVLGMVICGTRDFRSDYRMLLDRAVRLRQDDPKRGGVIGAAVLTQWIDLQRTLASAAMTSRTHLDQDELGPEEFAAAAELIGDLLERDVRPVSHGLWTAQPDEAPRIRIVPLFWGALRPWRPPVAAISVLYAIISSIGAVTRAGVVDGIVFAAYSTITVALMVGASRALGSLLPRSRVIGIATLILLPVGISLTAEVIGQHLLHTPPDAVGAVVAGLSAAILTEALVLAQRVSTERDVLLRELQRRIDAHALELLARSDSSGHWERRLGTFVHHSVQSELTAMRLHLQAAALAADSDGQAHAREEALLRFERLLQLTPPWEDGTHGREVVGRVAIAWDGIADVSCTLTPSGSIAQWHTVGEVVEEGVANAIRTGGARNVTVTVETTPTGALTVLIDDDGSGAPTTPVPGLGTWWLDRIAPDAWERSSTGRGTRLTVHVT